MIIPLMPKGVEHLPGLKKYKMWFLGVIIPLMPKGVEHLFAMVGFLLSFPVIIPLMPKGVEHKLRYCCIGAAHSSDYPSDAERR